MTVAALTTTNTKAQTFDYIDLCFAMRNDEASAPGAW